MPEILIHTKKKTEVISITRDVEKFVAGIKEGLCFLYLPHATAALTINESADPALKVDFLKALDGLVPNKAWQHDRIDNNASAHIKSALVGCSLAIPVKNGTLALGQWQDVWLCEFDGPRERKIIVQTVKA